MSIERQLLTVGEISLRLGVAYSRLRVFLRRPRRYIVRAGVVRAIAAEDLPKLRTDLEAEGCFRVKEE